MQPNATTDSPTASTYSVKTETKKTKQLVD